MSDIGLISLSVLVASAALSFGSTVWLEHFLVRKALLDRPNERSSHKAPVPRGGGWGIVTVLLSAILIISLRQRELETYLGVVVGIILLVFISWLDDRGGVHAGVRLAVHLVAAYLGSLSLPADVFLFTPIVPFWFDRLCLVLLWAWFINLYNFMDGIDGITAAETISIGCGVLLLTGVAGLASPSLALIVCALIGACFGFMCRNWSPAKIFLGDVGSIPLGFITGFFLITLALHGLAFAALILPLYYLADSGITIGKRLLRGEKIWQAHRQHYYQRAVLGLDRHAPVVVGIISANIVLIGLALLARTRPLIGLTLALLVVAILLAWMHKTSLTRGRDHAQN